MKKLIKQIKLDGWANLLTGLGVKNRDKRLSSTISWTPIQEADAEELYAQDDIARKIVNKIPEEALRQGFKIKGVTPEQSEKIMHLYHGLCAGHRIEQAWKMGRLHGGAAIVLITEDINDLSKPIELKSVKQLRSMTVLTRWELIPSSESIQRDITKPDF